MPERMVACASHSPLMQDVDGGANGAAFEVALETLRLQIETFDPTLVVMFGPDHKRAFPSIVPAFGVVTTARGLGDWGTPQQPYDVPEEAAIELAGHLLAHEFDVAVVNDIQLDHGFGQTAWQLFGRLDARPIIPVFVNCAMPPLPALRRVLDFGRAVGSYFNRADFEGRVLFLASGGLSHNPPTMSAAAKGLPESERKQYTLDRLREAGESIKPEWDEEFLRALRTADWGRLAEMSGDDVAVAGSGANEVRTWVAAAAAGGGALTTKYYGPVPNWITGMGIVASDAMQIPA